MNPLDHDGRHDSPWFERAESVDVVDVLDNATFDDVVTASVRLVPVASRPVVPSPVAYVAGSTDVPAFSYRGRVPVLGVIAISFALAVMSVVTVFAITALGGAA